MPAFRWKLMSYLSSGDQIRIKSSQKALTQKHVLRCDYVIVQYHYGFIPFLDRKENRMVTLLFLFAPVDFKWRCSYFIKPDEKQTGLPLTALKPQPLWILSPTRATATGGGYTIVSTAQDHQLKKTKHHTTCLPHWCWRSIHQWCWSPTAASVGSP